MNILINASNLKVGGGVQVAQSIIGELSKYPEHYFIVVYSDALKSTSQKEANKGNIDIIQYNMPMSLVSAIKGRNTFLDNIVKERKIDAVLTIFGPSRWTPKVPHLCGFAISHLTIPESPFFSSLSYLNFLKLKCRLFIIELLFKRCSKSFWTENEYITKRLARIFKKSTVYTITNYYNQVFDNPNDCNYKKLEDFNGCTLLTVSSLYPHKNLGITIDIAKILNKRYSEFDFRFVITVTPNEFYEIPDNLRKHFLLIGKIDISECPSLYEQADIMFQPTLLECFSATYPEAMRMRIPIITTDLAFARGLCGNAAKYYNPLSAEEAADLIYELANDKSEVEKLINYGTEQLKRFDNYEERTCKLIHILENLKKDRIC